MTKNYQKSHSATMSLYSKSICLSSHAPSNNYV